MRAAARWTIAVFVVAGMLLPVSGVLAPKLERIGAPGWVTLASSLGIAALAGGFVNWALHKKIQAPPAPEDARERAIDSDAAKGGSSARSADEPRRAMILGTLVVGAAGFAAGFFGPMIFSPGANQGPLLGILITGPLGAMAGAALGWFWWATYKGPGNKDEGAG